MENWLPIPGFEGRYEVSDLGRARTLRRKGRSLNPPALIHDYPAGKGYRVFHLYDGERFAQVYVHRAVLMAFRGFPPAGMEGAHLDGVRDHNLLANLMWATRAENHSHKVGHGTSLRGERGSNVKLKAAEVRAMRAEYRRGVHGHGTHCLAAKYGVSQTHAHDIVNGNRWAHLSALGEI